MISSLALLNPPFHLVFGMGLLSILDNVWEGSVYFLVPATFCIKIASLYETLGVFKIMLYRS